MAEELTPQQQAEEKKAAAAAKRKTAQEAKAQAEPIGENPTPDATPEKQANPDIVAVNIELLDGSVISIVENADGTRTAFGEDNGEIMPLSAGEYRSATHIYTVNDAGEATETEISADEESTSPETSNTVATSETQKPPAGEEEEAPPSPATSYAQTPAELPGRQQQTEEGKDKSRDNDLRGALGALGAIADPDSKAGRLVAKGRKILAAHPDQSMIWITADGFGFLRETDALNHAADKKDKTILTVTRE